MNSIRIAPLRDSWTGEPVTSICAAGRLPCDKAALFCPQQDIVTTSFRRLHMAGDGTPPGRPFQEAGHGGERQPSQRAFQETIRDKKGQRRRDPNTQAIETIHQPACDAVANERAKADNQVRGPILLGEKVSQSPHGKSRKEEPDPECLSAHFPFTGAGLRYFSRSGSPPIIKCR